MRVGDEGRKTPVRLGEPRDGAVEDQPPVDPQGVEYRAPDRGGEVALDEVLELQEVVSGVGLPIVRLGFDRPGRDLVIGGDLRPADGGRKLIEPAEFPQFGPEHTIVLREAARIVSLDIDDVSVLNAHEVSPGWRPDYSRRPNAPRAILALIGGRGR